MIDIGKSRLTHYARSRSTWNATTRWNRTINPGTATLPEGGECMGAPSVSLTLGAGSKKISMNLTENLERERVGGNYPQRLEGRMDGCYSVALYETGHKGRPLNRPYQIIW